MLDERDQDRENMENPDKEKTGRTGENVGGGSERGGVGGNKPVGGGQTGGRESGQTPGGPSGGSTGGTTGGSQGGGR